MTGEEKTKLKKIAEEISQMPMLEILSNAKSIKDFSEKDQKTIQRLDEIFWKEVACTDCGRIFSEVNPVGGSEKAESIRDAVHKASVALADVMYVGDSITDVEAFRFVRENGGLTVSFNGNHYAIRNAEIAILSENSTVTAVIADIFSRFGKKQALSLVENWNREALKKSPIDQTLLHSFFKLYPRELPKVKIITSENMEILEKESSKFREKVRGDVIGRLG
jgi:energy-converting hydrogenase A subunit R